PPPLQSHQLAILQERLEEEQVIVLVHVKSLLLCWARAVRARRRTSSGGASMATVRFLSDLGAEVLVPVKGDTPDQVRRAVLQRRRERRPDEHADAKAPRVRGRAASGPRVDRRARE